MKRRLFGSMLALALLLATTSGNIKIAQAHAILLRTDPPDGALLAVAPHEMRLWLSQAISIEPTDVTIITVDGIHITPLSIVSSSYQPTQVGLGDQFDPAYLFLCSTGSKSYPTVVTITLPALTANTYKISWHALALDDYIRTAGMIVFNVKASGTGGVDQNATAAPQAEVHSPASKTTLADGLVISLNVEPNQPGRNFILLNVFNTRRPEPAPIDAVEVQLAPPDRGAAMTMPAVALGNGHYQIGGDMLTVAGDWQMKVTIHRAHMPDTTTILPWQVLAANEQNTQPITTGIALDLVVGILAGVIGLASILFGLWWRRHMSALQTSMLGVPEPIISGSSQKE